MMCLNLYFPETATPFTVTPQLAGQFGPFQNNLFVKSITLQRCPTSRSPRADLMGRVVHWHF